MEECEICGKMAVDQCAICGKSLCNEHIKHGLSLRTNNPAVNCPSCKKTVPKMLRNVIIIMSIGLVAFAVILIVYYNSIFSFLWINKLGFFA